MPFFPILWIVGAFAGLAACSSPSAVDPVADVTAYDADAHGDGDGDAPHDAPPAVDVGADAEVEGPCEALGNAFVPVPRPAATPPFAGTVWFSEDLIVDTDPTSWLGLTYLGQAPRTMFDRRTNDWVTVDAHLFDVRFGAETHVEFQVNPEFSQAQAEAEVAVYAEAVGRLPAFLFSDFETVWMHRGDEAFGGGNNNLLIHTDRAEIRAAEGTLEEVMVHELSHTSMDPHHADSLDWLAAQAADGMAISDYALEFPEREDLAETVGPYLGARFRASRLADGLGDTVLATIPNRVLFLDCLGISMEPVP